MSREEKIEFQRVTELTHTCDQECGCGSWPGGRRAIDRWDGRRGRVTIDVIEGNDDGSR